MKARWFGVVILAILVAGVMPLLASCDLKPRATPATGGDVNTFKAALEKDGFTVQEGQIIPIDVLSLCCAGQIPTCLGFNPIAPYKSVRLPKAPGQTTASSFPWVFRLGANEAVILVGRTPPPMAYFSYDSYVMTRYSNKENARKVIFGNLGDTISNLTVSTGGPAQDPFNREVLVVYTADQGIDGRIRKAAGSAGYPANTINTGVIPAALARLGLDDKADELGIVHRISLPQPGQEAAFAEYLKTPRLALRVTLKEPGTPNPFPLPVLRVRGTGKTEMALTPAVEALRQAILARYSNLQATELTTEVVPGQEYECLQKEINGYGPTRDSLYLRSDSTFRLPDSPDDFLIVYGVNHEALGKAAYASLNVYEDSLVAGVAGDHSRRYAGSARDYLPAHPQADQLYAWKLARDCRGDPHCREVKMENCAKIALDKLPDLLLVWRLYQERETRLGPASGEVIYDQVILFSPATSTPTLGAISMDWQTYINAPGRFSIRVPPTWRTEVLPEQAGGAIQGMAFKGPEGGVEVYWGAAFGGGCTGEIQTIKVAKGELSACYTRRADGAEMWDQMSKQLSATTAVSARAYTSNTLPASHAVVLRVLSTWALPE